MTTVAIQPEGRERALGDALQQITKAFGAGAIQRLDGATVVPVSSISTGVLPLDVATGVGGIPRGRVTEVYGPESSGKKHASRCTDYFGDSECLTWDQSNLRRASAVGIAA